MPYTKQQTTPMPTAPGKFFDFELYDIFSIPAGIFTVTSSMCQLPIINGAFSGPLASYLIRNGTQYILTSPGQTVLQNFTVKILAESTATTLVTQGYAAVILGSIAATAAFGACVTYQIGDLTYNCYLSIHEAHLLALMEENPLQSKVISKDMLQRILDDYRTLSTTRSCLSFFMGKGSLEISLLKTFLEDNMDAEYISLNDLAKALCKGKQPRVQALTNCEKITNETTPISGTDRIINEIIENSISLADLVAQNSAASSPTP